MPDNITNNNIKNKENMNNKESITVKTKDALYEAVFDKDKHKTYFIKCDINGNITKDIDEIAYHGTKHIPIHQDKPILKSSLLLPSDIGEEKTDQEIINIIKSHIHKYLCISDTFEEIASYYVLFTWIYDRFNETPYLRALGDFNTGKSRFLQTIGHICYKPMIMGGGTTMSPMFRIIDSVGGTLILDEADFQRSDISSDIIKILNSGYQRGSPIARSEGKGVFEVKHFEVFGPKVIATRETYNDKALESRCLTQEMGMIPLRDDIERNLTDDFFKETETIRNTLLRWRMKKYFMNIKIDNNLIPSIYPRLNQIINPILAIIDDQKVKDNFIKFMTEYSKELSENRSISDEGNIIFAILRAEIEYAKDAIHLKEILQIFNTINGDERDNITSKKLGWYINKKLNLKTERTRSGYVLSLKKNKEKIEIWKNRFNITEDDVKGINKEYTKYEHVNNDNIPSEHICIDDNINTL